MRPGCEAGEGQGREARGEGVVVFPGDNAEGAGDEGGDDSGEQEREQEEGEVFSGAVQPLQYPERVQEGDGEEEVGGLRGRELIGEQAGELEVWPEVWGWVDGEEVFEGEERAEDAACDVEEDEEAGCGSVGEARGKDHGFGWARGRSGVAGEILQHGCEAKPESVFWWGVYCCKRVWLV